jgi:hypothetical protein
VAAREHHHQPGELRFGAVLDDLYEYFKRKRRGGET